MPLPVRILITIAALSLPAFSAVAGPYIPAGDLTLRHDIQHLADAGVLEGPRDDVAAGLGPDIGGLTKLRFVAVDFVGVGLGQTRARTSCLGNTQ